MALNSRAKLRIVALAGGVGGAKLAHGLAQVLSSEQLTVVVNTGDDFTRYGLAISPDLYTVMYMLADVADPVHGWGLAGGTLQNVSVLKDYCDCAWFRRGEKISHIHWS